MHYKSWQKVICCHRCRVDFSVFLFQIVIQTHSPLQTWGGVVC